MTNNRVNEINVRFGQIIRNKRLEKGMTLKQVGSKIGYSLTGYKHIEDGDRDLPLSTFFTLCQLFDLNVNEVQKELSK